MHGSSFTTPRDPGRHTVRFSSQAGVTVRMVGLLDDYTRQAVGYDRTRGVSQAVLSPLTEALAEAPGPRLVDIGGGTGNYSEALRRTGFRPTVVDRSTAMLKGASEKGLSTVEADATSIPFADDSFDGATLISMLHHVDDPQAAMSEAKRVVVPGGVVAVMAFTREDIEPLWVLDYFPSSRRWMVDRHLPEADLLAKLPGARQLSLGLDDLTDASMAALCGRPELVLDPNVRNQTSYFERMERDHPAELAAGLRRLGSEVEAGTAPSVPGTATLLTWTKPL